ncbi:MAG: hypothetical protein JRI23_15435 [Deltaproteobacteria bacterium]|jgi:hypothetical protein|nr:hypothetical protein [Deltaproteobacteria bacterium]MBW2533145.1 hypothetical protein [Deltaproteobacteria bacterium]
MALAVVLGGFACAPATAGKSANLGGTVERIDPGPSHFEAEIGGMDEYATNEAFNALAPQFARCVEQRSDHLATFGGHAHIAMRVKRDGRTRWAYLKDSTLGDRQTERCVLSLVRQATWPRPLSGEGLADSTFEVEPRKEPNVLDSSRAGRGVVRARNHASSCRKGVQGTFRATVYLDEKGRVLSAGVAPPSEEAESVADCVAESLEGLYFGFKGNPGAKATFDL